MKIQFENGTVIEVNTDIDSKTIEALEIVSELIKQAYQKGLEDGANK